MTTIEQSILGIIDETPDTWIDSNPSEWTDAEEQAAFHLTAAGLLDRRITLRARLPGANEAIEATISATGEYGMVEAM